MRSTFQGHPTCCTCELLSVTLRLGQVRLLRRVLRFGTSHTMLDPKEFIQLFTSYSL